MYPFEIHLTTSTLLPTRLAYYVAACEHLGAKPLVIELARGAHPTQPMLSKVVHAPDLTAALALAAAAASYLQQQGWPVTRTKLETAAYYLHLATPRAASDAGAAPLQGLVRPTAFAPASSFYAHRAATNDGRADQRVRRC